MIATKYQQQEKQQEEDKQEQHEIQDPLTAFMYGLKAPEMKRQWPRRLKIFLDYPILDGTIEQKARLQVLLVKDDIKESRGNHDIVQLHSVTFFTKQT